VYDYLFVDCLYAVFSCRAANGIATQMKSHRYAPANFEMILGLFWDNFGMILMTILG
jgi:hypothetical protein